MDKLLFFPHIDQFGERTSEVLSSEREFEKTASKNDYAGPISEFLKTIKPEPEKYLYMLLHALGAGEVWGANVNGDYFPEKYLKHDGPEFGFKTFENLAKLYKHHENKDPKKSYGDVLFSHYDDDMHRVLLVVAVDREKAPDICRRIEIEGDYPDVSMGCKVPYDICSICGHKSKSPAVYCQHAKYEMNRIYPDGRRVYVINPTPRFFDISQVFIGAEKPAKFLHKIAEAEMGGVHQEKIASKIKRYYTVEEFLSCPSAILAEKLGYSTKSADMIKSVPAGETGMEDNDDKQDMIIKGLGKLRLKEKCLDEDTINKLSKHPVKKVLTTLTSKGITLGPGEFQKIILIRTGQPKLANILAAKNIQFEITDEVMDVDPMEFKQDDIDSSVEKIAADIMDERSDLQPHLFNRTMRAVNDDSDFSKYYEPSRSNVAPGLLGIAGLYLAYKKGLLSSVGPLNDAVENLAKFIGLSDDANPAMIIPIATAAAATLQGGTSLLRKKGRPDLIADSDMIKSSSARDLALVAGLYTAPHLMKEHVRHEAMKGNRPGFWGSLVYNHATPISIASVLTAPKVSEYIDKAKDLFAKSKQIGKMFKVSNKNTKTFKECFLKHADSEDEKYFVRTIIGNDFWSTGNNLEKVSAKSANIGTILGLALLGDMEE